MIPRSGSVRGLTEGAILAAVVALLAAATRYLPGAALAATILCPLPLTALVIRHGLRTAVLAAAVASAIGAMIGGPLVGLQIGITFAPLGVVLGWGVRRGWPATSIIAASAAVATLSVLANLGLALVIAGINPYTALIEAMQRSQEQTIRFYERLGFSREQIEQATGPLRQVLAVMPRLIPLLVLVGGATSAYINFAVGQAVLRRFGITIPALPPMSTWRAPAGLLWLLPAAYLMVWGAGSRYPAVETAGLNLFVFAQMVFSLQGLFVAWVFFDRYGTPRWLRWLILLVAASQPALGIVVFVLGLADAAFDLRGRWRAAPSGAQ